MIIFFIINLFLLMLISILFFFQQKSIVDIRNQLSNLSIKKSENKRIFQNYNGNKVKELIEQINLELDDKQEVRIKYRKKEKQLRKEIANISHDLRTPLTSILGYLELLNYKEINEEEKLEYIKIITKKSKILQTMITSYYELALIESEDTLLKLEKLNVTELINEVILGYYNDFETKNIKVMINQSNDKLLIHTDYNIMVRIITNIIQNALKYSETYFEINQYIEDRNIYLVFSNDTKNELPENIERIFQRTYIGEKSRNYGDRGLGLFIAKILIQKINGSINAEYNKEIFSIILKFKFT